MGLRKSQNRHSWHSTHNVVAKSLFRLHRNRSSLVNGFPNSWKMNLFFLHDVTLANNQGSRILIQRLEGENSVYVTYAVYGTSNYIHPWAESGVGWRKFINYASPILVWTSNVEESQCDFITTFEKKNENDFSTNLLCRKIVSGLYVSKTLWTATNKFPRLPYFIRPVNCRQVD